MMLRRVPVRRVRKNIYELNDIQKEMFNLHNKLNDASAKQTRSIISFTTVLMSSYLFGLAGFYQFNKLLETYNMNISKLSNDIKLSNIENKESIKEIKIVLDDVYEIVKMHSSKK